MQRNQLWGNDDVDQGQAIGGKNWLQCQWIYLVNNLFIKINISEQVHKSRSVFYAREITNRTKSMPAISKHIA